MTARSSAPSLAGHKNGAAKLTGRPQCRRPQLHGNHTGSPVGLDRTRPTATGEPGVMTGSVVPRLERFVGFAVSALPVSAGDCKRVVQAWLRGFRDAWFCSLSLMAAGSASGRAGQGARSARGAAPQASLTRPAGSGSCRAPGAGMGLGGIGLAGQIGGLSVRDDDRPGAVGRGEGSQPYLGAPGAALPRRHDD
jgi:hypothetical protein